MFGATSGIRQVAPAASPAGSGLFREADDSVDVAPCSILRCHVTRPCPEYLVDLGGQHQSVDAAVDPDPFLGRLRNCGISQIAF